MEKTGSLTIRYFDFLDRLGSAANAFIGLACCLLLGILDVLTPVEYVFSFLYLLPISFTTWFSGKKAGFLVSVICTALASRFYLQTGLSSGVWNIASTFGIFTVVALTLSRIRQLLETEKTLSRVDYLTGALNVRAFREFVEYEIKLLQREFSPFSIAYIDIDNFKLVNDNYGHGAGDELLKSVAELIKRVLRKTDIIARVGGDEFVIFFPSTNQGEAKVAIKKISENVSKLSGKYKLPITISLGVVTSLSAAYKLDELLAEADKLMYEVKNDGKNHAHYVVFK